MSASPVLSDENAPLWLERLLNCAPVALAVVYLLHLLVIAVCAVDIPYMDEWEALRYNELPAGPSLAWVFIPHNEHYIVATRLMVWALLEINGWNVASQITLNFLIYGLVVAAVYRFLRQADPSLDRRVACAFLIFLLSPINGNHFWGFQSQFHFGLLFFLAATLLLFEERQRPAVLTAGALLAVCSMYSFSAGFAASSVLAPAYTVFQASRLRRAPDAASQRGAWARLLPVALTILAGMGLWLSGFHGTTDPHARQSPLTARFWEFFVHLAAGGFAIEGYSLPLAVGCVLFVAAPVVIVAGRHRHASPSWLWTLLAVASGLTMALLSITYGRAGFGVGYARSARYTEFSLILIPIAVAAWHRALQGTPRRRAFVLGALFLFCFTQFRDTWQWISYAGEAQQRQQGVACVRGFYTRGGMGLCDTIYPWPMPDRLAGAKKIDLSFYRRFRLRNWQ